MQKPTFLHLEEIWRVTEHNAKLEKKKKKLVSPDVFMVL